MRRPKGGLVVWRFVEKAESTIEKFESFSLGQWNTVLTIDTTPETDDAWMLEMLRAGGGGV